MRTLFAFLLLMGSALSAEQFVPNLDESLKGLVWNKWETDNFIVLSIDFSYGNKLKGSIENKKKELFKSLEVDDKRLPFKCKIICVQNPRMLKKFFSLDHPKFEIRENEMAIWIDQERIHFLKGLLAGVCFYDKPLFLREGLSVIMSDSEYASDIIVSSDFSPACDIFSVSETSPDIRSGSAIVCLLIRREFGIRVLSRILSLDGADPISVCGFENSEVMNNVIKVYSENLRSDLKSGRTPSWYLSN